VRAPADATALMRRLDLHPGPLARARRPT